MFNDVSKGFACKGCVGNSPPMFCFLYLLICISPLASGGLQMLGDDAYNKHDKYVSEAAERTAEP